MACEYSANAVQTINPGESVVFTDTPVPCNQGLVRHRDDTGSFLMSGRVHRKSCGCCPSTADYLVTFGANIAIPSTGTAGEIGVALTLDGATIQTSTMNVTPAATEEYFHVSESVSVPVWRGCCETLTVQNISNQPILMRNASVVISRPDLNVTY